MDDTPVYTLRIHLVGGQTLEVHCTSYEIVTGADSGAMGLNYTPLHDWDTVGYLHFGYVTAIEVLRSEECSTRK